MNDTTEVVEETVEAAIAEVTQEAFDSLQADNIAMKSHMEKLLGEAKQAKAARRESEDAARAIEEDAARKKGDHEQLYNSQLERNKLLEEENYNLLQGMADKERFLVANEIAGDLAEGRSAELLKTHILPYLKYTDDGIRILDDNGDLTVTTIDQFKSGIRNGGQFDMLLKGNQASGGGATGGKKPLSGMKDGNSSRDKIASGIRQMRGL